MIEKVMVIDDDELSRDFLSSCFREIGIDCIDVDNAETALQEVDRLAPDLVVTDLRMPKVDGMEVVRRLAERHPQLPVVVVTAHGTIETAVEAMRLGAADFLLKPTSPDHIELVLRRLNAQRQILAENAMWRREALGSRDPQNAWVGESKASRDLLRDAARVAQTPTTILISGESGTGKERLASFVHASSPRRNGPFVKVNCAALPEHLLESELFGHERGAFTGATQKRLGRFELAHGGTLLLDEIGELKMSLQAKLLRVLEQQEFERVGGSRTIKVNVRVLAATNRSLIEMVRSGAFREDLYYRLNVYPLHIPALRDRREDVIALAQAFLAHYAPQVGSSLRRFTDRALDVLTDASWPGNVRELQNLIQRLCVRESSATEVTPEMLPLDGSEHDLSELDPEAREMASQLVGRPLEEIEREAILATLEATDWNKTEASRILGVTARTISNKMKIYRARGLVSR
ncbi:MAG: sigma-54-dependent Fis family transcriptional regulator [Planctomycetes bacterium]|nr:sigma-54-dependent Fis family transcriptional regulator [Planctomycetota bacterium]